MICRHLVQSQTRVQLPKIQSKACRVEKFGIGSREVGASRHAVCCCFDLTTLDNIATRTHHARVEIRSWRAIDIVYVNRQHIAGIKLLGQHRPSDMSRFSRGRAASPPYDDNVFATATETSFREQDLLHSTPQRDAFPLHYHPRPSLSLSPGRGDDQDSLGSADMSIELGRGAKRFQHDLTDMSSNAVFSFEHTPPFQSRSNSERPPPDSALRKQASVRRATASARANDALKRTTTPRAVSDTLPRRQAEAQPVQPTATFTMRGSRFASVRQVSSHYHVPRHYSIEEGLENAGQTPRRAAAGNPTVQSATYTTGQSFMLPDLPNITELVSGRNEGTPMMKRTSTTSRTRFVSDTHRAVNSLSVPQDEQAIFASLQVLGGRVAELELEKSEALKHVERYEHEATNLRSQREGQRADSGIGSEDDDLAQPAHPDEERLNAKITAGEERLHKIERKLSVSEITITRVSRERDHLIQQLASAFLANEELEKDNESLRSRMGDVLAENENLKARLQDLTEKNALVSSEVERRKSTQKGGTAASSRADRRRSSGNARHDDIAEGLTFNSTVDNGKESRDGVDGLRDVESTSLASRVQLELKRQRTAARETSRGSHEGQKSTRQRSRSRSQHRAQESRNEDSIGPRRAATSMACDRNDRWFAAELTGQSQQSSKYAQKFEEDLTQLTDIDPLTVANLRRKLEEEMRARHSEKQVRAQSEADFTTRSTTQHSITRKSSMRDVTAGAVDEIAQSDHAKTVRVQSPHTADEISHSGHDDISSFGNISRCRRRSSASEGLTSAFIIPDITVAMDPVSMSVPVTDRLAYNPEASDVTLRPVQTPALALSTVIKHLEAEISRIKAKRDVENAAYTAHDPALARRARLACLAKIDGLTSEIERRSDQVYALYDALEAHKEEVKQNKLAPTSEDTCDAGQDSELEFEGFSETGDSEAQSREARI